jgi:hypothetical protein
MKCCIQFNCITFKKSFNCCFQIPLSYKRFDLTDVLQEVAANSVIWEIPSLKRAITYVNSDTQVLSLKTEGINFQVNISV